MELDRFIARIGELEPADLLAVADRLRSQVDTTEGHVAWWRATCAVSDALRRHHRSREAGLCAHRAASMVLRVAERAHLAEEHRDAITLVGRSAGDAARGMVAGAGVVADTDVLLDAWLPFLEPALAASSVTAPGR